MILLYAGNLTEEEFPRRRLVRQLGWLFVVVVAGGLLGTFAPHVRVHLAGGDAAAAERSPQNGFVRSLVHPASAQLQEVLGFTSPRPAAPFGYTNTWGNALPCCSAGSSLSWIEDAGRGPPDRRRRRSSPLAAVPVVYSLNRGLWIGLGAGRGLHGRPAGAARAAARSSARSSSARVIAGVIVLASPLGADHRGAASTTRRATRSATFTIDRTLEVLEESPVLGFGSTRAALGSSNSIAVGADADCPRCGNPTLGSNGQLWLLLIAQGIGGAVLYIGFFVRSLWAFRRDRTPIGDAGLARPRCCRCSSCSSTTP